MLGQVLGTHCNIKLLKIKISIDIFGIEKCKVAFGFKYICCGYVKERSQ